MIKNLFTFFMMFILIGCTVIGSQPVLSFKSINRENLIVFLQDSKNAIFVDADKNEIAGTYKIASNEKVNDCYTFTSNYDFHIAGNNLYFTSENSDNENIKEAQRIFYIDHKNGSYKQLPLENFSEIYDFSGRLWVNINNKSFYEYSPDKDLGVQTENVDLAFNGIHFQFNNDFYLRSGTSLVKYGTFNVIEMTSDEDKNIINKLSSDWIAPFYVNSSADVVEVKEITSITPNIKTQVCTKYTKEELAGSSICYISQNNEKNTLFIIRSGNKTTIDKYTKNSETSEWSKNDSKSVDNIKVYKNICKETDSDIWAFATDSGNNRVFLKISKETLEIKEVR